MGYVPGTQYNLSMATIKLTVNGRSHAVDVDPDPVTEQVSRVALDSCKVTSAWARPDQGWPFMSAVYVHTKGRNYQFSFFTADPNSPVVKQVLDSVALG